MRYVVDLHSHSGYAGGVGDISLETVADTMAKKGIHAFGVGDCLQPAWRETLATLLEEKEGGLYALRDAEGDRAAARFVMQTEIIITSPVPSGGRKGTHVVLLFPGFKAVDEAIRLFRKWETKLDIGRPFLKCADAADVAAKCSALQAIDESVMVIPAHILMPQGAFGSDHPVDSLADLFGEFAGRIHAVETGLSADPELLSLLPELDGMALVSNSDCHSGALNRVGREFTALDLAAPSYQEIVQAIRGKRIAYTAEFNPAEGRYFFTGHKAGLQGHGSAYCYFSPDRTPPGGLCPICGKPLTIGVLERAMQLARRQAGPEGPRDLANARPRQPAKRLVPLVEVLAAGLGVKSVSSRKVTALFDKVVGAIGAEAALWELAAADVEHALGGLIPETVLATILLVHAGDFSFQPGYDGEYGGLVLGRRVEWFNQSAVYRGGGHDKWHPGGGGALRPRGCREK